ncbi:hypothetical protein BH11ARM1_BH11ARM1_00860 [soil metagenome]
MTEYSATEWDELASQVLHILDSDPVSLPRADVDVMTCPNCGVAAGSDRSPYCGTRCREIAAFVRQFRAAQADGSFENLERRAALGQVLWFLLGGGYPRRIGLLTPKIIASVLARHGGKCELCDSAAVEIDHIATACNRPINLRAVCWQCHKTRAFGDADVLSQIELIDELKTRTSAIEPIRCCDDSSTWDWRAYVNKRKSLM